jgi:hypothetical protein
MPPRRDEQHRHLHPRETAGLLAAAGSGDGNDLAVDSAHRDPPVTAGPSLLARQPTSAKARGRGALSTTRSLDQGRVEEPLRFVELLSDFMNTTEPGGITADERRALLR